MCGPLIVEIENNHDNHETLVISIKINRASEFQIVPSLFHTHTNTHPYTYHTHTNTHAHTHAACISRLLPPCDFYTTFVHIVLPTNRCLTAAQWSPALLKC